MDFASGKLDGTITICMIEWLSKMTKYAIRLKWRQLYKIDPESKANNRRLYSVLYA